MVAQKKEANQQTPIVETVIANIDIEMEITSILTDSTQNKSVTAVGIRDGSAKGCH